MQDAHAGRDHLGGIEALRALAALSILVFHVWKYGVPEYQPNRLPFESSLFLNLESGLTLFFALSGFLLYRPFAAAILSGRQRPTSADYLRRRAFRILPAYWVVLAVVSALGLATTYGPELTNAGRLPSDLLLQNALLLQGFTPDGLLTGIPQAWSLGVELVFYLLLPLLALLSARLARVTSRPLAALAPPVLLLLTGLAFKVIAATTVSGNEGRAMWGDNWHSVLERSFLVHADLFSFGMAAAVAAAVVARRGPPARVRGACGAAAAIVALAAAAAREYAALDSRPYATLIALAAALLILFVVLPGDSRPRVDRALLARPLVYLGVISYSVYLWHFAVVLGVREILEPDPRRIDWILVLLLTLAITLMLSALSYRFVEKPMMDRARWTIRRRARAPQLERDELEAAP